MKRPEGGESQPSNVTFGHVVRSLHDRQETRDELRRQIDDQQHADALVVHTEGATRALERNNPDLYEALTDVAARILKDEPLSAVLEQYPELTGQNLVDLFGYTNLTPLLPETTTKPEKQKKPDRPRSKARQSFHSIMKTEDGRLSVEQKRIELFTKFPEIARVFGDENLWREIDGQQYIPAVVLHGLLGRSDGKPYNKSSAFQVFYLYWRPWTETHHTRTLRGKENGRPMLISKTDTTQFLWVLDIALSQSRTVYRLGGHGDGEIANDPGEVKKNGEFGAQLTGDASSPDSPSSGISSDLSQ